MKGNIRLFCFKSFFLVLLVILPVIAISIPQTSYAETEAQREARLRKELEQVEKEQRETEVVLQQAQSQSASLERDILILNTKIKSAQLNIKAKQLQIETLTKDIGKKEEAIDQLEGRIDNGKETLAVLMRRTNEIDSHTLAEVFLSQENLSDFFIDVDNFNSVESALYDTFSDIRNTKTKTEDERNVLDKRKNQELDAKKVIEQEKKNIEVAEAEKKNLLAVSRSTERTYEQVLAQKRTRAAEIRAALFSLRDADSIPFEQALQFATVASSKTGVRPAFLLAILTQESALGKNVGSCYLTDPKTGAGASVKSGNTFPNVMKPGRDVEPFIVITKSLGRDPYKTLVSCPQSIGWGGAMGPAQFIASTWMIFKDRIANAVGKKIADPWNPMDAFMASAIYLSDLGANAQTYTAERNSACRYYSGRACDPASINITYGTQVMIKADNIQRTMIDPLQGI
jgi:membrane-bound lytic murein transglycosylase B